MASLQRLPALSRVLAEGRKHGACCVLGLQALPQLRERYGRDGAAAICATAGNWLVLRTTEPETARWLADGLGKSETDEADESLSLGAGGAWRDGVSLSRRTQERHIVLPAEIQNLAPCSGFLRVHGPHPVGQVKYGFRERPVVAERFLPRPERAREVSPDVTPDEHIHIEDWARDAATDVTPSVSPDEPDSGEARGGE